MPFSEKLRVAALFLDTIEKTLAVRKRRTLDALRCDLGLHEDEDEDEDGGQDAGGHHPNRKLPVRAHRRDQPTALLRTGHGESTGHVQFLPANRKRGR